MEKGRNKTDFVHDDYVARLEEIKDDIKTIGTRSTWLLGLLVVIVLAISGFIFADLELSIDAIKTNPVVTLIKAIGAAILFFYLAVIAFYTKLLMKINFGMSIYEPEKIIEEETPEEIKKYKIQKIKFNNKRLKELSDGFNALVSLFVRSLFWLLYLTLFSFTVWAIYFWVLPLFLKILSNQ